jgi:hypothetical protein
MWLVRVEDIPDLHVRVRWRIRLRRAIKQAIAERLGCSPNDVKIRLFVGAPRSNYESRRAPRPR